MQKEQNVKKLIMITLLILFTGLVYSQKKLDGSYSFFATIQEHYSYYEFNKNGIFEYHSGASLGDNEFGKGHYYIKNDSLILNYDLTKLEYKSYHKIKEYYNSQDSINLKVKVSDFKGRPNINANVFITEERIGDVVDNNGFVILKFKKERKNFILDISNLGYEGYKLKLSRLKNYEIEVFLRYSSTVSKAVKGDIFKFKILEITTGEIKLQKGKNIISLTKL